MKEYWRDNSGVLYQGEVLAVLKELLAESVDCCITSPPYWGLRDYGVVGQLGLEKTPEEYVAKMVEVFREVKRVLKKEGTLWLNMGDSFISTPPGTRGKYSTGEVGDALYKRKWDRQLGHGEDKKAIYKVPNGYKCKDLAGVPWLLAFALRADGWYLRQDIIWHKPNPMPESVTDRCTKSHEYVFLMAKSPKYYFDGEVIKEPAIYGPNGIDNRLPGIVRDRLYDYDSKEAKLRGRKSWKGSKFHMGKTGEHQLGRSSKKRGEFNGKTNAMPGREAFRAITETRNKRSVWSIATQPYPEAHFATFPPDLITPMVKAGCPTGGIVLDPFMGSGTTAAVAKDLGRRYIGIDLNPKYLDLAIKRLRQEVLFPWTSPRNQMQKCANRR